MQQHGVAAIIDHATYLLRTYQYLVIITITEQTEQGRFFLSRGKGKEKASFPWRYEESLSCRPAYFMLAPLRIQTITIVPGMLCPVMPWPVLKKLPRPVE